MKKNVLVAGHICLDLTPMFSNNIENINEIMTPGSTTNLEGMAMSLGGVVANTGLAMAKFGQQVNLLGKVGTDEFGNIISKMLKEHNLGNICLVKDSKSNTSFSVVLAPPNTDRIFFHYPGANDTFGVSDISDELLSNVDLLHFGYPPLMKNMFNNNGKNLINLLEKAQKKGVVTSMDMTMIDSKSEAGTVNWVEILSKSLPLLDIFTPSIEEVTSIIDPDLYQTIITRNIEGDLSNALYLEDIKKIATTLSEMGAKIVLLKCGAPGLYYKISNDERTQKILEKLELNVDEWLGKEGFECSYVPDNILSATGAGDVTIAAFLTSILNGFSVEKSVKIATGAGAMNLSSYDAIGGITNLKELEQKVESNWKKQHLLISK